MTLERGLAIAAHPGMPANVALAQTYDTALEAMLDCAPAFIIALSLDGKIEFINRTLPQFERAAVIGVHWSAFFVGDQRDLMTAKLAAMYDTGKTQVYTTHTPGPDGHRVWFETQIAPLRVRGDVVGAVLVSQDVTERERAQAELLANRHMALLGTLAAGVAHEINTPIQFVSDSVQFLREASTDLLELLNTLIELRSRVSSGGSIGEAIAAAEAAQDRIGLDYIRGNLPAAFDRCVDGLGQISRIVRSLKDFAHPTRDDMAPVDLNRIVETALTIGTNEIKHVARVEKQLGALPAVVCNGAEISQVFLNILINAAHAIGDVVHNTGERGTITVATRVEGDDVVIAIADTGTGIPETIRSRIFDPFFTTKEVGKGTGQGLSIAWSIVTKRHRGQLTFESTVGVGTTFTIRLPIDQRENADRSDIAPRLALTR